MKTNLTLLFVIMIILQSGCRKSYLRDAPGAPDTLLNWKRISTLRETALNDIWFTTPAKGFLISSGRILYSEDSGENWVSDPGDFAGASNLYFTNEQSGFAMGKDLKVTRDGGKSWVTKPIPVSNGFTFLFVSPSVGFYCAYGSGFYRTADAGNTWEQVLKDSLQAKAYYPYFINADTGFVATSADDFARTTDGGKTWQLVVTNLPVRSSVSFFSQICFLDARTGFFGNPDGLFKTTDGGATWLNILPVHSWGTLIARFPAKNAGYYMAGNAIYQTMDEGASWSLSCKLAKEGFTGMQLTGPHSGWACTWEGSVLRLTNE